MKESVLYTILIKIFLTAIYLVVATNAVFNDKYDIYHRAAMGTFVPIAAIYTVLLVRYFRLEGEKAYSLLLFRWKEIKPEDIIVHKRDLDSGHFRAFIGSKSVFNYRMFIVAPDQDPNDVRSFLNYVERLRENPSAREEE